MSRQSGKFNKIDEEHQRLVEEAEQLRRRAAEVDGLLKEKPKKRTRKGTRQGHTTLRADVQTARLPMQGTHAAFVRNRRSESRPMSGREIRAARQKFLILLLILACLALLLWRAIPGS